MTLKITKFHTILAIMFGKLYLNWNVFEKNTFGKQFMKAIDSISANIAVGFGCFSKKDKIKFYRYGYGSVYESLDWN